MRKNIKNRLTDVWKSQGRRLLYYACLTAVLCAAAVCAERIRTDAPKQTTAVSHETPIIDAPEVKTPTVELPENVEILREYAAEPIWNKWLSLYETHGGTDAHFADGEVVSLSDGTVCAVAENRVEIATGEIRFVYCGIEPAAKIEIGTGVRIGDLLGAESGTVEEWMPEHVHLETVRGDEKSDLMEELVNNVT